MGNKIKAPLEKTSDIPAQFDSQIAENLEISSIEVFDYDDDNVSIATAPEDYEEYIDDAWYCTEQ